MKSLIFDTGPLISLTTNNLLWVLAPLKKRFGGSFSITGAVVKELVDRPLQIKKFEFEALQIQKIIREGVLSVVAPRESSQGLVDLANQCFKCKGQWLKIIQNAETEILVLARDLGATAVVDERTVRLLVEDPDNLQELLVKRLKCPVQMVRENVKKFQAELKGVNIIRSAELVGVAFSFGVLDPLVPQRKDGRSVLLDAALWGLKFNGCAITQGEIEELKSKLLRVESP